MNFLLNVNLVFLSYVAQYLLGFALTVVVTRELGPEGRGLYTLFLLAVSIAQAVLGLGVGVAAIYHIGKKRFPMRDVMSNAQTLVLASALASGLLVLLAWPIFGDRLAEHDVPYWLFALAVPLFLDFTFLTMVLQGSNRFLAMNFLVLLQPLVMLTLVGIGLTAADLGVTNVLWLWTLATALAVAAGLALVGLRNLHLPTILRPKWEVLREQVKFGVQGQVGNLLQLLNYRLDSFLVLAFVNAAGVGLYAVGVAFSESVWFIANAVAVVLVPRLTGAEAGEAARLTPVMCRNTLLVSAVAAVGVGLLSPVLVEAFFGSDFSGAVPAVLWLLPGTVALSGTKILAGYIFSQGRPLINSAVATVTLATTIALDLALIPPFEIAGAAAASSVAYGLSLVLSLVAYRRLSGQTAWGAVLPQSSDIRLYVGAARNLAAWFTTAGAATRAPRAP